MSPTDASDAAADFDDDGLSNLEEFTLGTIPINPDTDADGLLDGALNEDDPLVPESILPSVVITNPVEGGTYGNGQIITVSGVAQDNAVVESVTLFLNGVEVTSQLPAEWSQAVTMPIVGTSAILDVIVRDLAGNTYASQLALTLTEVLNRAPIAHAGADQDTTVADAAFTLSGQVQDDGLPNPPGAVTTLWSLVSGPSEVTINNTNVLVTTVGFVAEGVYTFELFVSDSVLSARDTVVITVNPKLGIPSPEVTQRISVNDDAVEGDGGSYAPRMSANGRHVVYTSRARNLSDLDTDTLSDVYIFDRESKTVELISQNRVGLASANNSCGGFEGAIDVSDDGQLVVFISTATDLIDGDNNNQQDVFLRDVNTNVTTRISQTADGIGGNKRSEHVRISGNGQWIVFQSQATNLLPDLGLSGSTNRVYLFDRQTGALSLVSKHIDGAELGTEGWKPDIDEDGSHIVFASVENLVNHVFVCDGNCGAQIYLFDRVAGVLSLVTQSQHAGSYSQELTEPLNPGTEKLDKPFIGNGWSTSPAINDEGTAVAFTSRAKNFVAHASRSANIYRASPKQRNTV